MILKTVKNIVEDIKKFDIDPKLKKERYLTIKILRNEVIKWIKDMEAEQPYGKATWAAIMFARSFLDIKKEEIKNGN